MQIISEQSKADILDTIDARIITLDGYKENILNLARSFCRTLGFPVDQYEIVVVDQFGYAGMFSMSNSGRIYLSVETFAYGPRCVSGALLKEFWHLSLSLRDNSLPFQNFLIDTIVNIGARYTGKFL